jgi:uncharacterized membrane protein YgcG
MAGSLLAQVFGGGSQVAPQLTTVNPNAAEAGFLGQNFSEIQNLSNSLTSNTSAANLATNLTGLNTVDPGALTGIQEEQTLGNGLLGDNASGLPAWAQQYMSTAAMSGNQAAIGRGVGAYSGNALSGVNQFLCENAMQLVGMGSQLANNASGEAQGIVNQNMYRQNPMDLMLNPGQFLQAGEMNTGILNQQAVDNAAVTNYNNNNSPLGNMLRTGLQMGASLLGSFLGDNGLGSSMNVSNGTGGPMGGSYTSGGGGGGGSSGGGGMGGMGMLGLLGKI